MAVISRWPVYRGSRYNELVRVPDEGVLGDRYIEVTVISRWPLYLGGRYIKVAGISS